MATADPHAPETARETFASLDPATGEEVARFPVHDAHDIAEAVDRARIAARWWADLGFAGRKRRLLAWKSLLAQRIDELAVLIHRETGKPVDDATLEIIAAIDHIDWAARHAGRVLRRRSVRPSLMSANQQASLGYQPYGVIAAIGPWNYPVLTPMGSLAYALAAGNAVVFKPSELTPAVGAAMVDWLGEAVPEQPVLQLVTGAGATGDALVRSGVDKVAFTGSGRTGRKIMAACAERLTPVLMECGGKDAVIVCADADLPAAADAIVFGAMSNGGQTCLGVERVYVAHEVADELIGLVEARALALDPGSHVGASYGPATLAAQLEVVSTHVDDALARGGQAIVGGRDSVRAGQAHPVVLVDVPEESLAVLEETFGPTVTIARVRDDDDAIARVNASSYGLGSAIFTRSRRRGQDIAERLQCGMASINAIWAFAFAPALPFGGVGESGFGRIHGADGLREFARAKAVTRQRFALPVALVSFDRKPETTRQLVRAVQLLHGRHA
jgi:acyl-CoA reductase-like NAD-dependent aldehyde dehydrogenase